MTVKKIRIALAGNPNVGKSVIFNALTGGRQHVGNWPGKTVEKKEGTLKYKNHSFKVIDLPGTYSLTAYSIDEIVARDYLVEEKPDVVIHVVDSTNLERNLYLTIQLIELGAKVILALNMSDLAEKKGLRIDERHISRLLGIPVIKTVATKEKGVKKLLDKAIKLAGETKESKRKVLTYGKELEEHIEELRDCISKKLELPFGYTPKWTALKLLENDKEVIKKLKGVKNSAHVLKKARETRVHLQDVFGEDVDSSIADARYGLIAGLIKESVKKPAVNRISMSDQIDKVVTNKYLGIPIFLLAMFLMFQLTFEVSAPFMELIDEFFGWLAQTASASIPAGWLSSLVSDGIISGVGSVLIFIPPIFILFLIIALLEDSGYMARAAFIMDKLMHKIGLHGKSFIPMILGFGCNVPAIMATRTLSNRKDRLLTILINPFMSCGARLPVYILFAAAFFPNNQGLVVFSLYILGMMVAIIMGLILSRTLLKGLSAPFVMELPPYRVPTIKGALIHMWERGSLFLRKAGTIIFAAVVLVWALSSFPAGVEYGAQESYLGQVGTAIAPVFGPLGFGDWRASVALMTGFVAKEIVIGTFGTIYGVEEGGLEAALQQHFTPLSAYSFLVFVLLYVPCMAVIAVIKRETNSWKWPLFTAAYTTAVAWIVAFIVYQGGLLLGFV